MLQFDQKKWLSSKILAVNLKNKICTWCNDSSRSLADWLILPTRSRISPLICSKSTSPPEFLDEKAEVSWKEEALWLLEALEDLLGVDGLDLEVECADELRTWWSKEATLDIWVSKSFLVPSSLAMVEKTSPIRPSWPFNWMCKSVVSCWELLKHISKLCRWSSSFRSRAL